MSKRPIHVLEPHEVEALLDATPSTSWTGMRARVQIRLMWQGALRCNSARHVRPCDLRIAGPDAYKLDVLGRGPCRCQRCRQGRPWTRGGRSYAVTLDRSTIEEIERFLPLRARKLGGDYPEWPLTCSQSGLPCGDAAIRRYLGRLGRRVLPDRRVNPNALRDAFAYEKALDPSWPLARIADQLGQSTATTARRLHRLYSEAATVQRNRGIDWQPRAEAIWKACRVNASIYRDAKHFVEHIMALGTGRLPTG